MKISNAFCLRYCNKYGKSLRCCVLLSLSGFLYSTGCSHSATTTAVQQLDSQSAGQPPPGFPNVPLPVVERNHQIVAVGKYVLPEPIILPDTVSVLPMATAMLWSRAGGHTLIGVTIYFPEHYANAVLAWARTYPVPVAHMGVAFWYSKRLVIWDADRRPPLITAGSTNYLL